MNPRSSILRRKASSYGLIGGELDAFGATFEGITPHPRDPRAYRVERPSEGETARPFATVEILLDTWTNPNDPKPFGAAFCYYGDHLWIEATDDTSLSDRFLTTLTGIGAKVSTLVVWNGMGVVFHTFLRHLARPLTQKGVEVHPLVSGSDIKAIILKRGGQSWILTDPCVMSGLTDHKAEGFCASFTDSSGRTMTQAQTLYRAMDAFQGTLLHIADVAIRPTVAVAAVKAARYHLKEGEPWYRPNLALEAVCRYGGAYRGGYVHSEGFQGPAWRIDVNKMYTSLLRSPLPGGCALSHAGEYLREKAGIFLCRVEGESNLPVYISAYTLADGRYHKQRTTAPAVWAWLPSAEFVGMRALGYKVIAGLGFKFTRWVSLASFAEQLFHHIASPSATNAERLVCKSLGNALTGKLGQSPDRLEVCYSVTEPRNGWLPFVTAEREVIPDLWWKRHQVWKGEQHVDAAAWLTSQGRGKVMSQLARVQGLGWRAVHADTDGLILDSDPRGVLPLSSDKPGAWRYDGFDPDCLVAKGKWYSFQGEVHTAGLSGVTREQLEAVHYGRQVVIGRKVLANPLSSGPAYREQEYRLGGA